MPRKLRVEYPGAIYHVMNRGDRREAIFRDDADRIRFLETLGETCAKTGWQVHAYCLMENHFHLVMETPEANLVAGMKWFLGTYTVRFNRRHKLSGHLFSGRYKSLVVDGSGNGYLRTVCDYVHLNPVRAKLVPEAEPLEAFRWSSYPDYLKLPTQRPPWMRVDPVLGEAGIPQDSAAGRREFSRRMESRRQNASDEPWQPIRRGWCLGDEAFRQELLGQMNEKFGAHHYGAEKRENALQRAERIIREELARLGWSEALLAQQPKGDAQKVGIARRLREETTLSMQWIAEKLCMGATSTATNAVRRIKAGKASGSPVTKAAKFEAPSLSPRSRTITVKRPVPEPKVAVNDELRTSDL